MNTSLSIIDLDVIEGEILRDVLLSPEDMARMNAARDAFKELRSILLAQVVPALGGFENPLSTEIERHLEMVTFRSHNFLWPHRHAGAAHDAINAGGCQ